MTQKWWAFLAGTTLLAVQGTSMASVEAPPRDGFTEQTQICVDCHEDKSKGVVQQWGSSKHYGANVGCYECHKADASDPDAFLHGKKNKEVYISTIVSPKDCGNCHEREVREYTRSHHSQGGRIIGSLDNLLADVVEGNRAMKTPGHPEGVSAAVVNGCWQCHGTKVIVLKDEEGNVTGLDPTTWPNTGIGRINPDESRGSCSACHSRHRFSVAQARNPENCGKCHMGPDHPQEEIYVESKHGIAFRANIDKMNMESPKWIAGEDYNAAPTCASCHMSATKDSPVTHDVGLRISWTNRPAISIRPEETDKKLGLPGQHVKWDERRENMKEVCTSCHSAEYVENFYTQYDNLITLYNNKFGKPGLALYKAAKPLFKRKDKFANHIDFTWFEIWHHEGRRARHGASMMGPDWTHWHGTYEVAKHFYGKYIPELEELIEANIHSDDPAKREAAEKLEALLEEVLSDEFLVKDEITGEMVKSTGHLWFSGKMNPAEAARRKAEREAFETRYGSQMP